MLTPNQMNPKSPEYFVIDELENEIDATVKIYHGRHPYEYGYANNIYPPHICYRAAFRYYKAGWKYVYYKTVPDRKITSFVLSMTPLDDEITDIASWECVNEKYLNSLYEKYKLDNQEK